MHFHSQRLWESEEQPRDDIEEDFIYNKLIQQTTGIVPEEACWFACWFIYLFSWLMSLQCVDLNKFTFVIKQYY